MLCPKKTKFKKQRKGKIGGIQSNTNRLTVGKYGVKALQEGYLTARNLEAVRKCLARYSRRSGQIWIRVYPDRPVTAKPAEVRMGKGKGSFSFWTARVKAGQIIFELDGISLLLAKQMVNNIAIKFPFPIKFLDLSLRRSVP